MAYTDLVNEVADWLARDDLNAAIPTFIRLAEQKFYRELRLRFQETEVDLPVVDQVAVLPADFLKVITILSGECKLDYVTRYTKSNSLSPTQYSTLNFTLLVGPNIDEVSLRYYARPPALTAIPPFDTNWILENAYDLYLYGALQEAEPYIQADSRLPIWKTLFEQAMSQLIASDKKDKLGEGPLVPTMIQRWTP